MEAKRAGHAAGDAVVKALLVGRPTDPAAMRGYAKVRSLSHYTYIHIYTHIHVHIYKYICMYIYICICHTVYVCIGKKFVGRPTAPVALRGFAKVLCNSGPYTLSPELWTLLHKFCTLNHEPYARNPEPLTRFFPFGVCTQGFRVQVVKFLTRLGGWTEAMLRRPSQTYLFVRLQS